MDTARWCDGSDPTKGRPLELRIKTTVRRCQPVSKKLKTHCQGRIWKHGANPTWSLDFLYSKDAIWR